MLEIGNVPVQGSSAKQMVLSECRDLFHDYSANEVQEMHMLLTCLFLLQPLAYMSLHIALTTATFAVSKIFWDSYVAHTAFLLFVFCWAVWNGETSAQFHATVCCGLA